MHRLILTLLLAAALCSTGCIAAVPLLLYASKNRQASAAESQSADNPGTVQLASHEEVVK